LLLLPVQPASPSEASTAPLLFIIVRRE